MRGAGFALCAMRGARFASCGGSGSSQWTTALWSTCRCIGGGRTNRTPHGGGPPGPSALRPLSVSSGSLSPCNGKALRP
eukprot:2557958-Prymnesium_polylepis.1